MIGVPFLGLLCAIFQTGMVYFEAAQLQEATQIASRAILTQSAASGMTYGTFLSTYVCPQLSGMFNCASLQVDIESPANWTAAGTLDVGNFYNSASNTSATVINMPAANSIAVVRILYPMSQMAAIIGGTVFQAGSIGAVTAGETTLNGQTVTMLVGIYAFRVEP
jgi:Flp pilus assembly protein TadG